MDEKDEMRSVIRAGQTVEIVDEFERALYGYSMLSEYTFQPKQLFVGACKNVKIQSSQLTTDYPLLKFASWIFNSEHNGPAIK